MSNIYFLTDVPYDRKLNVGDDAHFYWDGKGTMILSLKSGYRTSTLHFKPGDAFRATQEGNIVRLSKLAPPRTLSGVVLWACHAEKVARVKNIEAFQRKLDLFKSSHRILTPEPDFLPVWETQHRIKMERCTGPFLFLINEKRLQIARYSKHKGTMWATIAAYCDPTIPKDEAEYLIKKYGIINAPQWYISNAIHSASTICIGHSASGGEASEL